MINFGKDRTAFNKYCFGFLAKCIRSIGALLGFDIFKKLSISFCGKPVIRGQFDSLFPEYESSGLGLDAMEVFSGIRKAVSR